MLLKEFINKIKYLNQKASIINRSIPKKNPTKFANNPFRKTTNDNIYVWVEKE